MTCARIQAHNSSSGQFCNLAGFLHMLPCMQQLLNIIIVVHSSAIEMSNELSILTGASMKVYSLILGNVFLFMMPSLVKKLQHLG
ncbi:hypothetical protein BC832DRAFT_562845 [Gaertneriomyces semiglobifer]|nr:hypothetical protein BC832DRAFT_562845 [Gaertneriomyces semiglobifer]